MASLINIDNQRKKIIIKQKNIGTVSKFKLPLKNFRKISFRYVKIVEFRPGVAGPYELKHHRYHFRTGQSDSPRCGETSLFDWIIGAWLREEAYLHHVPIGWADMVTLVFVFCLFFYEKYHCETCVFIACYVMVLENFLLFILYIVYCMNLFKTRKNRHFLTISIFISKRYYCPLINLPQSKQLLVNKNIYMLNWKQFFSGEKYYVWIVPLFDGKMAMNIAELESHILKWCLSNCKKYSFVHQALYKYYIL